MGPASKNETLMHVTEEQLIAVAAEAMEMASAPYSDFRVGAALETSDGEVVKGCNIENASYGLTMCAERVAIFKAVSDGKRKFSRIAIFTAADRLTPPCGACRQIIWEFCGDVPVILANKTGLSKTWRMSELLPEAFDGECLESKQ